MTIEERMNKINQSANASVSTYRNETERKINEVQTLANNILKDYGAKIQEVIDLANYAVSRGYAIQCHSTFISRLKDIEAPRFQSDGICHGFGLISPKRVVGISLDFSTRFIGVGSVGGGCAINTLLVTPTEIKFDNKPISQYNPNACYPCTNNKIWSGCDKKLMNFKNNFEKFYMEFMNYIDNIDTYKCFAR